jgi:hypothetical protein
MLISLSANSRFADLAASWATVREHLKRYVDQLGTEQSIRIKKATIYKNSGFDLIKRDN